jgi:hypothetical protein
MTLRTITLARTVQVRQYEPLTVTYGGDLADGEDPSAAATELLERVRAFFWDATGHARTEFAPPARHGDAGGAGEDLFES